MQQVLELDTRDSVLIALDNPKKVETITQGDVHVMLMTDVPAKQKFPTQDLVVGDSVTLYEVLVGKISTSEFV
jgi:altronate hydrolase